MVDTDSSSRHLLEHALGDCRDAISAPDQLGAAFLEGRLGWHHHFVCRRCRVLLNIPCVKESGPCMEPDPSLGLLVKEAQVIVRWLWRDRARQPT